MRTPALLALSPFLAACGAGGDDPRALESRAAEYAALPEREELTDRPYLNGKALLLLGTEGTEFYRPDSRHFAVTEGYGSDVLAASPREVGTVARLDCEATPGETYELEGGGAVVVEGETCVLTLVDLSLPAVIHREEFRGRAPASRTVDLGDTVQRNSVNVHDVVTYLEALPRR